MLEAHPMQNHDSKQSFHRAHGYTELLTIRWVVVDATALASTGPVHRGIESCPSLYAVCSSCSASRRDISPLLGGWSFPQFEAPPQSDGAQAAVSIMIGQCGQFHWHLHLTSSQVAAARAAGGKARAAAASGGGAGAPIVTATPELSVVLPECAGLRASACADDDAAIPCKPWLITTHVHSPQLHG